MNRTGRFAMAAAALLAAFTPPAAAGMRVYENGDRYVDIGGRIQVQYNNLDLDDGPVTDSVFFRRLRPFIAGSITRNWEGMIAVDFGKAIDTDEVAIKDAYMRYTGFAALSQKLTIGNQKPLFSRSFLTSSKRQELVERPFTGNHEFAVPDRFLGVRYDGKSDTKKVSWGASLGSAEHDPNADLIDFDSPTVRRADFNQGVLFSGRMDFHPLGEARFDMGDLSRAEESRYTLGVGTYYWRNDGDNNTYTDGSGSGTDPERADLDHAAGIGVSGAYRGYGFSVDAEVQRIRGDTVDRNFTGGLYRDGLTDIDSFSVIGGYMVVQSRFEVVAAWQRFDASNYEAAWTRASFGANYFWNRHNVKLQFTYRIAENSFGIRGDDRNVAFLQMQFVF